MPKSAKFFVAIVSAAALIALASAVATANWEHAAQFGVVLVLALATSRLKVSLPGLEGNLSVNLPFLLIAAVQFGMSEALVVGLLSTFAQSIAKPMNARRLVQLQFNCATIVMATFAARITYLFTAGMFADRDCLPLVFASAAYLLVNVSLISTVISLSEPQPLLSTFGQVFTLSFPHFVIGAGVANFVTSAEKLSWHGLVALLPVMFLVYRSYRRYFATRTAQVQPIRMRSSAAAD